MGILEIEYDNNISHISLYDFKERYVGANFTLVEIQRLKNTFSIKDIYILFINEKMLLLS